MKEHPIVFDQESVRAILDGSKTQTRRVVKPQPPPHCDYPIFDTRGRGWFYSAPDETGSCEDSWPDDDFGIACPYGKPGDRLWVREAHIWGHAPNDAPGQGIVQYGPDDVRFHPDLPRNRYSWARIWRKRPAIHMPRWASRITLEVVGVRVERLQDISFDDALAEGIETDIWDQAYVSRDYSGQDKWFESWGLEDSEQTTYVDVESIPQASFRSRWDAINGKRAPWASNPWVWVVEFRRIDE